MPRSIKAAKSTVWRESTALLVAERQRLHARRGRMNLEVSLRSAGFVLAVVSHIVQPEGREETLADMRWTVVLSDARVVAAAIDVAKQWAENEADRLAGTNTQKTRGNSVETPVDIAGPSGETEGQ